MAKKAYIGVDGVARKIKKGYVGVNTEVPIYKTETITESITDSNIINYFYVNNSEYYFVGSGSTFTTNNKGVQSSEAKTILIAKYDMDISFTYSYSSQVGADKFTLNVNGTIVENGVSSSMTTKTYSGTLSAGSFIVFQYIKNASINKYDDECTFSNMSIVANVITKIGTEHKEVARRIKNAYIGIGGVARPCWDLGKPTYYGKVCSMFNGRDQISATTVGDYALFGAGIGRYTNSGGTPSVVVKDVDAVNSSLTHSNAPIMTTCRAYCAATTVGDYAIFAGGKPNGGTTSPYGTTLVEVYDSSLVKQNFDLSVSFQMHTEATTIGDYAIFAGGWGYLAQDTVAAINKSLTVSYPESLCEIKGQMGAASNSSYAYFGLGMGEQDGTYDKQCTSIDKYTTSLTHTYSNVYYGSDHAFAFSLNNRVYIVGDGSSYWYAYATDGSYSLLTPPVSNLGYKGLPLVIGDYVIICKDKYAYIFNKSMTLENTINLQYITEDHDTYTGGGNSGGSGAAVIGQYALFSTEVISNEIGANGNYATHIVAFTMEVQ